MFAFVDFSTLDERLKDRNTITEEFLSLEKLWRKARFIVSARSEEEKVTKVMEMVSHPASYEDVMRFINLSMLERRLKDKDTISVEYMNKSGLWRRGRFIVSGRDERGKLTRVLWLSEDIYSEKKERDRLINMSERAIAANEAKSAFLSNMSHELRTPINAILGMNEVILRECQDEKLRSCSETIESTGSRLLSLVNDILDFSGIEAGKLEIGF